MIVTRLLSACKTAAAAIVRYPKDALIVALLLFAAYLGWRLKAERQERADLAATTQTLPPDTKQVVTVYRDRVVTRTQALPGKIEYRDRYFPPEGQLDIVTKDDQKPVTPEVAIKDHGFTLRLGGGYAYSERLLLQADAKVAYWGRYGLLIGVNREFSGLGAARRIDDLTPFSNLEIFCMAGLSWHGTTRMGIGVRTSF